MNPSRKSPVDHVLTDEEQRLNAAHNQGVPWKKWGPYLSERQWGTVREDYSQDGNAWDYFSHDQSRSRAYRWGEDGLGGICDDQQVLCFALALWNGADPILKERLFGLTNSEGNHGEDVKEYYFYLDSRITKRGRTDKRARVSNRLAAKMTRRNSHSRHEFSRLGSPPDSAICSL